MHHIAVIGAGITGVTSAYALAQQGFQVTLIEKNRYAGMETSYANGGQLSASNAEVWNHPSTLIKGLKWVFTPDAPLLMNPLPTWHKLSWMTEFVAALPRYRDNTIATTKLAIEARQHLFAWAQAEGIDFKHEKRGILHIYRDQKGFDHAANVTKLLAQGGLERRAVTPDEMRSIMSAGLKGMPRAPAERGSCAKVLSPCRVQQAAGVGFAHGAVVGVHTQQHPLKHRKTHRAGVDALQDGWTGPFARGRVGLCFRCAGVRLPDCCASRRNTSRS